MRRSGQAPAEPPFPLLKLDQRSYEIILRKVGPIDVGHDELGVRGLIEQEVREPLLAAGPDQQIELRQVGRIEIRPIERFVDRSRVRAGLRRRRARSRAPRRSSSAREL